MNFQISRSILWSFYATLIALIWGWTGYEVDFMEKTIKANLHLSIVNVAQSAKSQVQSLIETSDEILKTLKFHYERKGPFDEKLLNDYFQSGILNNNSFNQAGIIDKNGIYVYSSLRNQKRLQLSDREHFWIHKNGYPYQLFFSKPVLGRASNKWSIQITRKLVTPSGDFNGVAVLSIDPKIIISYFSQYNLGDSSLIALIDAQGYVRTMKANDHDYVDGSVAQLKLPEKWEESVLKSKPILLDFDAIPRYYTFEQLDNSDLMVLVGAAQESSLVPLHLMWTNQIYLAIFISLLLTVAATYFDKLIKSHRLTKAELLTTESQANFLENFYATLLKKWRLQSHAQLSKIQQDASYIESQSNEEMTSIFAKSINYHTDQLAIVTDNALKLESLQSKQIKPNPTQISLPDFITLLETAQHLFDLKGEVSFQPIGTPKIDALLDVDIDQVKNIVFQTIKWSVDSGGMNQTVVADYELRSDGQSKQVLRFQFQLSTTPLGHELQNQLTAQVALNDIDLADNFEFMVAKYQLQQMHGHLVVATHPPEHPLLSLEIPTSAL